MIKGIGTDIIEVQRIAQAIEKFGSRFLDRLYTSDEQEYCLRHNEPARHFAGRFAAKEAVSKALGSGFRNGISWTDIEILNDAYGKPEVRLSRELHEMVSTKTDKPVVHVSISHCREYATAFAICEKA